MNFKRFGRTDNLFDYATVTFGKYINASGEEATSSGTGEQSLNHSDYISVDAGMTYTFKCNKSTIESATTNAFCWFDSDKQLISRELFNADAVTSFILGTATAPINATYLIMNYRGLHGNTAMLNEGSTALPYQPYKGWTDIPHYIHNTSTDTITALPAVLYPNAATATVGLKGQTTQSSVPSPTSPVMPEGTGERTGNLVDRTMCAENMLLTWSNGTLFPENGSIVTDFIRVNSGDELVTNYNCQKMFYDKNKVFLGVLLNDGTLAFNTSTNINTGKEFTVPNVSDIAYVRLGYRMPYNAADMLTANIMLNLGSTALPYEPYGYFIEIEVS